MSVSERINLATQAAARRGDGPNRWGQTTKARLTSNGVGEFKSRVHDALFERLGMRLFEAKNEDEMQSLVVAEITSLMDANETALTPQERQRLAQDIARDVMGLGPIEQFLNDPTVSEIMVNGSDNIYVERAGIVERTDVRFISDDHLRRVVERIVARVGRRIDESSADGRRPTLPTAHASTSSSHRSRWTARS